MFTDCNRVDRRTPVLENTRSPQKKAGYYQNHQGSPKKPKDREHSSKVEAIPGSSKYKDPGQFEVRIAASDHIHVPSPIDPNSFPHRQRHDLATVQQQRSFRDLDSNVQKIIMGLADGKKSFRDLSALIHASTKEFVSQEFEEQRKETLDRESCKSFLETLYFPEILSRQEEIADAHKQTFEWIFDASGSKVLPWNNFVEWLERGQGIYWINGKAGSGKSTLMSYIVQQPRTMDYLKAWSKTQTQARELCVPSFFFWSAGTQMQKSALGLLRSLIYIIVKQHPDLVSRLTEFEPSTKFQHDWDQYPAWTERRLIDTLQRILRDKQSTCCFCFFIDGLDEFSGDQTELIDLIKDLPKSPDIKICVSSRPLRSFQKAFKFSPKLQLQDLTESDIRTYISDKLPATLNSLTKVNSPFWTPSITDRIIEKARGVFLWVNLAVKDQIAGIDNEDTLSQLEERLERLPPEIEDVYAYMLNRIDKIHRQEAAVYLQIALGHSKKQRVFYGELSFFVLALMTFPKLDDLFQLSHDSRISDIIRHCRWTKERLSTTCVGFLEIHSPDMTGVQVSSESEDGSSQVLSRRPIIEQNPLEEAEIRSYYDNADGPVMQVNFLRRTTLDFFSESNMGKEFLKKNSPAEFQYHWSIVKAILATFLVAIPARVRAQDWGVALTDFAIPSADGRIPWIMKMACGDECTTGKSNAELLSLIDNTLTFVDQHYLLEPPQSHWCTRWTLGWNVSPFDSQTFRAKAITRLKSASTSSSQGSFYSLDNNPRPSLPSSVTSQIPFDFLGLATSYGVSVYVQEEIAVIRKQPDPDRATYLLACALNYLDACDGSQENYPQSFALSSQLLEKGADPNTTTFGLTPWHQFLQSLFKIKLLNNWDDYYVDHQVPLRYWAELGLKFLQSNANVHGDKYVRFGFTHSHLGADRGHTPCFGSRATSPKIVSLLG